MRQPTPKWRIAVAWLLGMLYLGLAGSAMWRHKMVWVLYLLTSAIWLAVAVYGGRQPAPRPSLSLRGEPPA